MYIQLFPTLRCNAACDFCFNRGLSAASDMSIADFGLLADILSAEGIRDVDILGGEPTLHTDLAALINIAASHSFNISMSSNGSDLELLESLANMFSKEQLRIGISMNGSSIDAPLAEFISAHKPMLKSVAGAASFIPEANMRFLKDDSIPYYIIFRDSTSVADLADCLSFPAYLDQLRQWRAEYKNIEGVYCSGFIDRDAAAGDLKEFRCPAGTDKISLLPDGSAYPCYLLFSYPQFRLGNLLTDNFRDIIHNPLLDLFRNFKGNECPQTGCELFGSCHGGCPALSLRLNGIITGPDPRCIKQISARRTDTTETNSDSST